MQERGSPALPGRLPALGPVLEFARPYRGLALAALVMLILAAGMVLGLGQALRGLVDYGFAAGGSSSIDIWFFWFFGVAGLLAITSASRFFLVSWLGEQIVNDVRRAVFRNLVSLSPGQIEQLRTGDIVSRLTSDIAVIQTLFGSSISLALRNAISLSGGLVLLFLTSWKLTLIVLVAMPVVVLPIVILGRRIRTLSRASQARVGDLSARAEEVLNAFSTVKVFSAETYERERFDALVDEAAGAARRRFRGRAILTFLVLFLVFGVIDLVLWTGSRDVLAGSMSSGELSAFVFYAVLVGGAAGSLSEVHGDVQQAIAASERLTELLEIRPVPAEPDVPPVPVPASGIRAGLRLDSVSFAYPDRPGQYAVRDVSLSVSPGETVAIVGPSGAGKSTLFRLILRFHDPLSGHILLDGRDIATLPPGEVRAIAGFVGPDPALFSDTVAGNIRYGTPGASDAEVRTAARAAQALSFVEALPDGFRTFLGPKGVRLSAGQRQRLVIARAILRNPRLLLLDEATNSLDAENEHLVHEALSRLVAQRTTLVIAHRLTTAQAADRIIVMSQGRITGSGSHDFLVRTDPLYSRFAAFQSLSGFPAVLSQEGESSRK